MVRRLDSVRGLLSLAIALGALLGANTAHAHIKLLKPASWVNEDFLGGPEQKVGPCGEGEESDMVTTFTAGETISVEWEETIAHPGFFRSRWWRIAPTSRTRPSSACWTAPATTLLARSRAWR